MGDYMANHRYRLARNRYWWLYFFCAIGATPCLYVLATDLALASRGTTWFSPRYMGLLALGFGAVSLLGAGGNVLSNILRSNSMSYTLSDQALVIEDEGRRHRIPRQRILDVRETRLKIARKRRPKGMPRDSVYCKDVGWVRQRFFFNPHGTEAAVVLMETEDEKLALIPPEGGKEFVQKLKEESTVAAGTPDADDPATVKRPIGVIVVGIFLVLSVIWNSLEAVVILSTLPPFSVTVGYTTIDFDLTPLALVGLIPAAVLLSLRLAAAFGLIRGARWAQTLVMVLLIIGIAVGATGLLLGLFHPIGVIAGIVLSVVILHYLTRPHVRAYFGK